jgi:hypothetical protein
VHPTARFLYATASADRGCGVNPEAELRHRGNAERIRAIEIDGPERDRAFAEYRATADQTIKTLPGQLPDPADHPTFRIQTLTGS